MSEHNYIDKQFSSSNAKDEANYDDFLSDFDLTQVLVVASKSIIWVVLILFTSILSTWLYIRYTQPIYQSSSILKLGLSENANILGIGDLEQNNKLNILSGEIEIIKSPLVYQKVLERMNIDVSYFAYGNILFEERYKNSPFKVEYKIKNPEYYNLKFVLKFINEKQFNLSYTIADKEISKNYSFGEIIDNENFTFNILRTSFHTGNVDTYFFTINSQSSLINYLINNTEVEILNAGANTIKISFKDHLFLKAYDIVNCIDSVYLTVTMAAKSKTQEQTLDFLEQALDRTETELAKSEMQMENFIRQHKTTDVIGDLSKNIGKITEIENEKLKIKLQVTLLNDMKEVIMNNDDLKANLSGSTGLNDPQLMSLITKLNDLQQERQRILSSQKENTFAIKSKDLAIASLRTNISELIDQSKKQFYERLSEVNKKIMELEQALIMLPSRETEFNRIKRFYNINEKYYLMLMEKKAEYGIAKAGNVPNFVILSPASVSATPVYPNKLFLYMTGGGIGLFLSILLIFTRYFLHNTISTQRELERAVKAPIAGGVPEYTTVDTQFSKLIIDKNPKSSFSEALRSIRTNLEFIAPNRKKKIIALTSTVSGEGKTFIAVNLAGVMALSSQKVIILDLDMRKPKIHHAFDKGNIKGMSTILIGKHTVDECITSTSIENLYFIPAGPTPPNPSELILRPEFDEMIAKLHESFDVVIIDTPPVGLVTDGVIILKKADVSIFIVRANYTNKSVKRSINALIQATGYNRLCVVLNALKAINTYGTGGYGYGYDHGYYEDDTKKSDTIQKWKNFFTKK